MKLIDVPGVPREALDAVAVLADAGASLPLLVRVLQEMIPPDTHGQETLPL